MSNPTTSPRTFDAYAAQFPNASRRTAGSLWTVVSGRPGSFESALEGTGPRRIVLTLREMAHWSGVEIPTITRARRPMRRRHTACK